MATLEQHFASYAEYHQTKGNKITHYFGIPMIMFSSFGMLAAVKLNDWLDLGLLLWVAGAIYYMRLAFLRGAAFAALAFGMYWVSKSVPMTAHVVLFVAGWILQGIGHYKYEKKSPAFLTNVAHLLIGPFWIFCGLTGFKSSR